MDRFEDQEHWGDDQVEIIDLEEDDAVRKRPPARILALLQRIRITPRARTSMLTLMISGSLITLLLVVQPGLFSFLKQPSAAAPIPTLTPLQSPTVPPFSPFIIQTTASDEAVYLNMPNGAINARRASNGDLLWYRAPSLSNDRMLAATDTVLYSSSNYSGRGVIEAFEAKDGTLLWRHQTTTSGTHTLRVQDGIVYVNMRGNVRALRASDGLVLWHFRTAVQSRNVSAVIYVQGNIAAVNTSYGVVHVLQANDGKQLFSYRKGSGDWRPYIDGDIIYILTEENVFKAINIKDGKSLWQQAFNQQFPLLWKAGNGIVYTHAGDGQLRALRGRDGTLLWQYPSSGVEIIFEKQTLYLITIDGFFTALRADTGSQIWRKQVGKTFSRVQVVNDILYFGEGDLTINAWRTSDGKQIWRYTSRIPIVWYPRIGGKQMYVLKTNRTMLDALSLDTGEVLWHYPGNNRIS